jgi:hypothetical protein
MPRQLNSEASSDILEDRSFSLNPEVVFEKKKAVEEKRSDVFSVVFPKLGKLRQNQQQQQLPAHILLPE